jgi:hypothetical protein
MKVSQLRKVFRVAERQYRSDHREDAAEALSTFATNLLGEENEGSVAALVSRVVEGRKTRAGAKGSSAATSTGKRGKKGHSQSKARRR